MLVPKLRFKREDGTNYPVWKNTSLGKIGDVAMCKRILKEQTSENGDVPFFKISTFGGTPDAYISYQLFDDFKQIYRFPQKGAILISAAGTIGKTVRYNGEDAYYQDSNIVWLEHDDSVVDDFLYQFYQQVSWEGLEGSTIKRLYNKNLLETPISLPCLEEQQKIANFLSTVDEVIAQSEAEVQNLEQQKKAAMQKIFSQEVRFKREDGTDFPAWEEKVFTDLFKSIPNKDYQVQTKEYKPNGKYRIIDQSQSFIAGYSDLESKVCYQNPCIIFGDHTTILKYVDFPFIVGADGVKTLITNDCYVAKYCFYLLGFNNVKPTGYNRHYSKLKELTLLCSTDIEEQQKIADFLSAYDEAIRYAKQELDKWKELKKGLLQQMFV